MGPGVVADAVPGLGHPGEQLGVGAGVQADAEEGRRHAVAVQDVQHPVGDGWVRSVVEGERDGRVLGVPSSRRQAPAGGDQRRCTGLAVPVGALGVRRPTGQRAALQHQFDEVGPARGGARQGVRVHGAELRPGRQGPRVGPQHPEPGREQAAVHHAVGAVDDAGQLGAALAGTLPQQPGQSAGPAGRHVHPGTGHGRGRVPEGHVQTRRRSRRSRHRAQRPLSPRSVGAGDLAEAPGRIGVEPARDGDLRSQQLRRQDLQQRSQLGGRRPAARRGAVCRSPCRHR